MKLQASGTFLKLKGGSTGTQILDNVDKVILESSSVGLSSFVNFGLLVNSSNVTSTITNTSGGGFASQYFSAATVTGQIYTGGGSMNIANTKHPMYFSTNRFVNLKSLSIECNGCVVINTTCANTSDTKLKDNQQVANLDEIQNIFDKIDVKT